MFGKIRWRFACLLDKIHRAMRRFSERHAYNNAKLLSRILADPNLPERGRLIKTPVGIRRCTHLCTSIVLDAKNAVFVRSCKSCNMTLSTRQVVLLENL